LASFEFEHAQNGGIGMRIVAEGRYEVYNACIGALGRLIWGELPEEDELPVVWYGFDDGSLAVALMNEMLYQHQLNDFCFSRFETERIDEVDELDEKVWKNSSRQLKIFGKAYGVFDPEHRLPVHMPVYAALMPRMKFIRRADGGYEFYCILDDVGGDFDALPAELQ